MASDEGLRERLPEGCAPDIAGLSGVLDELTSRSRHILGPNFVGAYVQGSIAQGDADLESDCDFLVVIRRPMSQSAFEGLAALHADLPTRGWRWGEHLEGSYPVADELISLDGIGAPWAYVDHGSGVLERASTHCNTPVTRRILLEHGITLAGPPPRALVEPVQDRQIQHYSRRQLQDALQDFPGWAVRDAWSQRYAVLTVARLLCSIQTGQIVTKRAGGQWVTDCLDPQWGSLVSLAVSDRGNTPFADPPAADLVDRTLAFGDFAQTHLQRTA